MLTVSQTTSYNLNTQPTVSSSNTQFCRKHSYNMDVIVLINSFITCVVNTEFN